jgi:putative glutathione S-transferase
MLRWLPAAFNSLLAPEIASLNFYPAEMRERIDAVSPWLQAHVNSGVYKAGFARDQETYEKNVVNLFAALNRLEELVASSKGPYILGTHLTELDLLAYPTLARFDAVYVQHFKANLGMIRHDYPVLNNYLKGLYWGKEAGWKESTDWKHIKENYTKSHGDINPLAITPLGPWPEVEQGYEEDWRRIRMGKVRHPRVEEAGKELEKLFPGMVVG